MISLSIRTLRHRKAAFAGAFVALLCAAALVCACGMLHWRRACAGPSPPSATRAPR